MPTHHDTQHSPYSPQQIFDLVADVAHYPDFLPWCKAARILEQEKDGFTAELVIRFKGFTERYTSRVTLTPPHAIDVEMVHGPFHHLVNQWRFKPAEQGGTEIDFFLDFAFRSHWLEALLGGMFSRAQSKMMEAFRARADALYTPT